MVASISSSRPELPFSIDELKESPDRTPHDLGSLVRMQLEALIRHNEVRDTVAGKLRDIFKLCTSESLNRPAHPPFGGLSHINSDGLPFQWVFRSGCSENGFGFLCEIGTPGNHPKPRCELTQRRLKEECDLCDVDPSWLDHLAKMVLPCSQEQWPEHWRSAMWIGVGVAPHRIGLKPYFNLSRGSARDRWLRAGWVLKEFGRERALAALCKLSSAVSAGYLPTGLAVDIAQTGQPHRVKIYFRSNAVTSEWLRPWYDLDPTGNHQIELSRCFECFPLFGQKSFPPGAFTMSLESHSDDSISLKCDFAVTKWVQSDREIYQGASALIREHGNSTNQLQESLEAIGAWPLSATSCALMRFVGLGYEPDGSKHVNLYVAPPLEKSARPRRVIRHPLSEAIRRGCAFLAHSNRNRHWSDFALPVGSSDTWVTAYVLARLGKVARQLWGDQLSECVDQSLEWLMQSQRSCCGWGYNDSVPPDADSTAWAILALQRHERVLRGEPEEILRRWKNGAGAFATYSAKNLGTGWNAPAPDVTACALNARSADWDSATDALFTQWMQPDGTLPAYWWTSRFYTTSTLLDWNAKLADVPLFSGSANAMVKAVPSGSFDAALLLHCLTCFRKDRARELVEWLCCEQNSDGSWPASAQLRLTDTNISEPWKGLPCLPIYRDNGAIFTTATVIFALSHFQASRL